MTNKIIFDLETDGLLDEVSQVWCIGEMKLEAISPTIHKGHDYACRLLQADVLIGHNIIGYDLPVLKKLFGYAPKQGAKIVDTLILSRLLCRDRKSHSLDSWGETLKFPKGKHTDWTQYSQEMADYCIQDVKVNYHLYLHLMEMMNES